MYTYRKMLHELEFLRRQGARIGSIGRSQKLRAIPFAALGSGETKIIITGGIHAREHFSSLVVMKQIEYALNKSFCGEIYFIPMVNPDGNFIAIEKPLYKANSRQVDLNVNFDALWGTGISNIRERGDANYIGSHPFSERETMALRDFTLKIKPQATISYHCLGREVYYEFKQKGKQLKRDKKIAKLLNKKLDYKLVPDNGTSAGGYKDWCIQTLKIPSLTIELGLDEFKHPFVDYKKGKDDIERNLDLPIKLLQTLQKVKR